MKDKIQENKVPLIVGVLILVTLLIYFYQNKLASFFLYRGENASAPVPANVTNNTASSSNNNSSTSVTNDTVLEKGDRGDKVGELQDLLNKSLVKTSFQIPHLVVDKAFGSKTENLLYLLTGKKRISINEFKKLLN